MFVISLDWMETRDARTVKLAFIRSTFNRPAGIESSGARELFEIGSVTWRWMCICWGASPRMAKV